MTLPIPSAGKPWFEWTTASLPWDRLIELADYHKVHGHCNVPQSAAKTPNWVRGSHAKGTSIQVA
jgi:hypothetical protein